MNQVEICTSTIRYSSESALGRMSWDAYQDDCARGCRVWYASNNARNWWIRLGRKWEKEIVAEKRRRRFMSPSARNFNRQRRKPVAEALSKFQLILLLMLALHMVFTLYHYMRFNNKFSFLHSVLDWVLFSICFAYNCALRTTGNEETEETDTMMTIRKDKDGYSRNMRA